MEKSFTNSLQGQHHVSSDNAAIREFTQRSHKIVQSTSLRDCSL